MAVQRAKFKKKFWIFIFHFLFLIFHSTFPCFAEEVKQADLAGSWYPASEEKLLQMLDRFLSRASIQKIDGKVIALIQPHAGFVYSGPVAAYGFKLIKDLPINTVLIVGFTHRMHFEGVSVYKGRAFDTPLGPLNINTKLARELIAQDSKINFNPQAFVNENSIELQLPFLKKVLPHVLIVAIAIGDQRYETAQMLSAALYNVLKDRDDFLLIASSDMSHYLTYDKAVEQDRRTLDIIEKMSVNSLFTTNILSGSNMLCGLSAVSCVILAAKKLGADNIEILKYANSGDTFGGKSRVVGYVSAAIYKHKSKTTHTMVQVPRLKIKNKNYTGDKERIEIRSGQERKEDMFTEQQKKRLLQIARRTLEEYLSSGEVKNFEEEDPALLEEKGAFVTLRKDGELRGCIGNIIASTPLYKTVRDMSIESATADPRFRPMVSEELKDIEIEISVLSKPKREFDPDNIIMGKHGVIVRKEYQSGVFLPQVADETGWDRDEFLSNLCAHKAGLKPYAWKDKDTELYTFTAEVFSESDITTNP